MTGPFGDDDVANNIWQQQQADAAPSAEEVKRDAERRLEEGECVRCGAEEDLGYCNVEVQRRIEVHILCEECCKEHGVDQ